ncbi:MAG: sugar phosphate isomerase/epimerase [Clostridia bacterium]|nr:sugar phosphate isomerase/epimerase [Clostridia bacterium]
MERKLGVSFNAYGPVPIDEQIGLLKKNGFSAVFTGAENPNLETIIPALRAADISCDNFHAPFNKINDIWYEGDDGEDMLNRLLVSVEKCEKYNVPALVVHLSAGMNPPYVNTVGHDRWTRLMESADAKGVTICYENQRKLSNLAFAFEEFPTAKFCWDCGHEFCFTPGRHYMPLFGDKLAALHIHDNSKVFNNDDHMIPYDSSIDFGFVADQIARSGYEGTLMLELIRKKTKYYSEWTAEDYYRHAGEAARRLNDEIEKAGKTI